MFLMKICMVDSGSAEEEREVTEEAEEMEEMLFERIMASGSWVGLEM